MLLQVVLPVTGTMAVGVLRSTAGVETIVVDGISVEFAFGVVFGFEFVLEQAVVMIRIVRMHIFLKFIFQFIKNLSLWPPLQGDRECASFSEVAHRLK